MKRLFALIAFKKNNSFIFALEQTSFMTDTYQTIAEPAVADFRDKGSKFLAFARPIEGLNDIKLFLDELRELHPKATHHCYAYRLGLDKQNYRANDDGEPSGTAGRPILGQIDAFGLTHVMVVVVRYFGGTKLGVPGLIHAYKTAAAAALSSVPKQTKTIKQAFKLSFDYIQMDSVMRLLKRYQIAPEQQTYAEKCSLTIEIRQTEADFLLDLLNKIDTISIEPLF